MKKLGKVICISSIGQGRGRRIPEAWWPVSFIKMAVFRPVSWVVELELGHIYPTPDPLLMNLNCLKSQRVIPITLFWSIILHLRVLASPWLTREVHITEVVFSYMSFHSTCALKWKHENWKWGKNLGKSRKSWKTGSWAPCPFMGNLFLWAGNSSSIRTSASMALHSCHPEGTALAWSWKLSRVGPE